MKTVFRGLVAALAMPALAGLAHADGCGPAPLSATEDMKTSPLTLEAAIARAGQAAPEVLQAALGSKAASAEADQAGRWLNPAVSLETENFAGSGTLEGFDAYETTLSFEQTFRLGDKRRLSERAARAEAALASAEREVQRLEAQKLAG
ncbi:TolC family protein [Hyphococcus sp.]|uniref:TolC family protein n=1 Tax=Hyphococcus sp. TaxID=2038636 RepID=UPI0035C7699C